MKKIIFPIIAVAVIIGFSAFSIGKPSKSPNMSLHWYEVTYNEQYPDGVILELEDFYVQAEKGQVTSPCDAGTNLDCLRGFSSPISSVPNTSLGSDQIEKP
ncbi:MAG: hypothetical protein M3352_11720 [Bacteroidota bacterium]|nr:hypothetical protein [Bacteroidota bacterium]